MRNPLALLRLCVLTAVLIPLCAAAQTYKLAPSNPGNVFVSPDSEAEEITIRVTNWGNDAVTSFAYTIYYTDTQESAPETLYSLAAPLESGESTAVQIPIKAGPELGQADVIFTITQVNGAYNSTSVPYTYITRYTVRTRPEKRVLVEEWTGMWCQYCTKGIVIMQSLERLYGDRFIGVAVHDGDVLATLAYDGMKSIYGMTFPSLWVGRKEKTVDVVDQSVVRNEFAVAPLVNIDVKADWDADHRKILVTSTIEPIIDVTDTYAIGYVLTADGLQSDAFEQKNNYDWIGMENLPPEAEPFTSGENVRGLAYDHVALASIGVKNGVEGSLSIPLKANEVQTHTVVFEDYDPRNLLGAFAKQTDGSNLHVVAMVINTANGQVVNAARTAIGNDKVSGIATPHSAQSGRPTIYDLSGRRVHDAVRRGFYIVNGKKVVL